MSFIRSKWNQSSFINEIQQILNVIFNTKTISLKFQLNQMTLLGQEHCLLQTSCVESSNSNYLYHNSSAHSLGFLSDLSATQYVCYLYNWNEQSLQLFQSKLCQYLQYVMDQIEVMNSLLIHRLGLLHYQPVDSVKMIQNDLYQISFDKNTRQLITKEMVEAQQVIPQQQQQQLKAKLKVKDTPQQQQQQLKTVKKLEKIEIKPNISQHLYQSLHGIKYQNLVDQEVIKKKKKKKNFKKKILKKKFSF